MSAASPTAAERRRQIEEKHALVMKKRQQADEHAARARAQQARDKAAEQHALDERARRIDRSERQAMIAARVRDHHDAKAAAVSREEREKEKKRTARWAKVREVGERLSEISVSWEDLPRIPDEVFETPASCEIISLNLVGLGLEAVSPKVGETFTSLRMLKLDSNKVQSLPENLCALPELREISAVRNRIRSLPFQFGLLCTLRTLSLPSNELTSLPPTMKMLVSLQHLNLARNRLVELPPMGDLPLRRVNLNHNMLSSLMPLFQVTSGEYAAGTSLTVLACNHNRLVALPSKISLAQNLAELYVCNNQLTRIPVTLGDCGYMERFWCDWNQLPELPVSMANWFVLKELKAEGNPIARPPPELIFGPGGCQGRQAKKMVAWCKRFNTQTQTKGYRQVLTDLQRSLSRIGGWDADPDEMTDEYKALMDVFEPDVQALPANPAKRAMMTAEDYDDGGIPRFYCFVLDDLFSRILPLVQPNYEALSMIPGAQEALGEEFFLHTRAELVEAITEYDDAYGRVGALTKEGQFRRCSCQDRRGRRRVCIPPAPGMMCKRRPVVWLRMQLTSPEQYQFHQLRRNEIKTLNSAIKDCTEKAEAYLGTRWGKRTTRKRARQLAKESRATRYMQRTQAKRDRREKARDKKSAGSLKRRLERFRKKNTAHRAKVTAERARLQEERDTVFGQAKAELEERLATIDELLGKENCLEGSDGEEFDDVQKENDEYEGVREEAELEEQIEDMRELQDDEAREAEQQKRYNRMRWRELLRATTQVAHDEYIREQCDIVRENVKQQFVLLSKVTKNWLSQAVKACYEAWRDWARTSVQQRTHHQESKQKAAQLERDAENTRLILEAMEAEKWVEKFDEFSERVFFEHKETGEIAWDEKPKRGFVRR